MSSHETEERVAAVSDEAMKWVGDHFNFKYPLASDVKIGLNWEECH